MKKILIILILNLSLFGYTSIKELKYESGISIYGQVGFVDLRFEENFDNNTYKMHAKTTSIGAVKYLSSNRVDKFTSEGKIKNGVYIPLKFTRHTTKTDYEKSRIYTFDYENNRVEKKEITSKMVTKTTFDPASITFTDCKEKVVEENTEIIEFQQNDFLSLYLNLKHGNLKKGQVPYVDMKEDDKLTLMGKNLFEIQKNHGEDKYNIVLIDDSNSIFFQKAASVGISFYGDAYIKKVSEKTNIIDQSKDSISLNP